MISSKKQEKKTKSIMQELFPEVYRLICILKENKIVNHANEIQLNNLSFYSKEKDNQIEQ